MNAANHTAYVILGLLAIEPKQSGYDIRKTIQGSVGYFWGESYGQIYPTLKRLEAEGRIAKTRRTSGTRKDSRQYSITPAGRAVLEQWLAAPFRDDPPRNEFLLKLFFGPEADPAVSIAHIRDFQERNRRLLRTLDEIEGIGRERHGDDPQFPFWMLTLTFGVAQIRAALAWSESALEVVAAIEKRGASKPRSARKPRARSAGR